MFSRCGNGSWLVNSFSTSLIDMNTQRNLYPGKPLVDFLEHFSKRKDDLFQRVDANPQRLDIVYDHLLIREVGGAYVLYNGSTCATRGSSAKSRNSFGADGAMFSSTPGSCTNARASPAGRLEYQLHA